MDITVYNQFMGSKQSSENLLAFALYKQQEITYISANRANGTLPDEYLAKQFYDTHKDNLDFYRKAARDLRSEWLGEEAIKAVESQVGEKMKSFDTKLSTLGTGIESLDRGINKKWRPIWLNIAGTVGFYLILLVLLILIQMCFSNQYQTVGIMLRDWLS